MVKAPKTAAGIRTVDLNSDAMAALKAQKSISMLRGSRVFLNPRTLEPWETDAQIRKSAWLPIMKRSGIEYRNPYQIRHTFASTLLTAGANPWYVAQQLGHEDVEMVFRTYVQVHSRGLPEAQGRTSPDQRGVIGANPVRNRCEFGDTTQPFGTRKNRHTLGFPSVWRCLVWAGGN